MRGYAHTNYVINSIKSTLLDLVLKLQEVDETIDALESRESGTIAYQLEDLLSGNIANYILLQVLKKKKTKWNLKKIKIFQILEDKLRKGLISSGQVDKEATLSDDDLAIKVK